MELKPLPTGYEQEQAAAKLRHEIAQKLIEKGMTPQDNMRSWVQVLGQLGQQFAGQHLERRATRADADLTQRMLADYTKKVGEFHADTKDMTPAAVVEKWGSDPLIGQTGLLKPYTSAFEQNLKDSTKRPNPTDPVIEVTGADGKKHWIANRVATDAALMRQGYGLPGSLTTDMLAPGQEETPPQVQAPELAPAPLPQGGGQSGGLNLDLLSPEEKGILQQELARRSGAPGAYYQGNDYTQQTPTNVPMGSPLTAVPAPAGVVNGKPYWIINGQPYDNPEGK